MFEQRPACLTASVPKKKTSAFSQWRNLIALQDWKAYEFAILLNFHFGFGAHSLVSS